MKRKLNRLLALLLCVLMMGSDLTGLITPALAAPPATDAVSQAAPLADGPTAVKPDDTGIDHPFQLDERGRANLFVHFLGDNYKYIYDHAGVNAGVDRTRLSIPAGYDQSNLTNPDPDPATGPDPLDVTDNTWERYTGRGSGPNDDIPDTGDQVLFWVGLGIDRREVLELLEGNKGLSSLEAGFYYDERYIEPYVDASGSFKATIEKANIGNTSYPANTQWSTDYEILRAEKGLKPVTDKVTQEEVTNPSIDEIVQSSDWKMTYVSLELKQDKQNAPRRLAGEYTGVYGLQKDANGDFIAPESAHGTGMHNAGGVQAENDYQYLLLIPFRLKDYDANPRFHLRLIRDATHFSIGGGLEGVDPYGAWERTTTRNPGRDIKLQTNFQGDLQLFGKENTIEGEVRYTVRLDIPNNPSPLNTAELFVDGDPSVYPAKATQDGHTISDLRSGIGMMLNVSPYTGFDVKVTVEYTQDGVKKYHTYTVLEKDRKYSFVIPVCDHQEPVVVTVYFTPSDANYHLFLSELSRDSDGAITSARKLGNETHIYTNLATAGDITTAGGEIYSYDPPFSPHPIHPTGCTLEPHGDGPMIVSDPAKEVVIQVATHADYMAVVRIYNYATGQYIVDTGDVSVTTAASDHKRDTTPGSPTYGSITLPYGGTLSLLMPGADLDVEIIYQPATRYKATLEVYHKAGQEITPMNTAQMAYLVYDDYNESSTAYSGVVYHQARDTTAIPPVAEDHRAVKGGAANKQLPWIAASQAALSGSLGGDTGRKGMTWNPKALADMEDQALGTRTVMAQLYAATSKSAFASSMTALDLNTQPIAAGWVGLRRDIQGRGYSDSDVAELKDHLWDLRTRILNDATLKAKYEKQVTKTVDGASVTLYAYLDLTPAQVQAYLLDVLDAQETEKENWRQYELARQEYLKAHALWEAEKQRPILAEQAVVEPQEPIEPKPLTAADSTGKRTYQDTDYQNVSGGYLKAYYDYLTNYRAYLSKVSAAGSVNGITTPAAAPSAKAVKTIPIRPDDASAAGAAAKLAGYTFKASPVSASATIDTRENRKVWVLLEGDSAYYVDSVLLYDTDGNLITTITPASAIPSQESGYANVWSFTMPKRDCVIRVTYARRDVRDIFVQVIGADGQADNRTSVEAYRYADHDKAHYPYELNADTVPVLDTITNAGNESVDPYPAAPETGELDGRYIYNVFQGSTVTIRVKVADGYSAKVEILNTGAGDNPTPVITPAPNPKDGNIYTFTVDATTLSPDPVNITVTYTKEVGRHNAWIYARTVDGTPISTDNTALWRIENPPGVIPAVDHDDFLENVYTGTHLSADIEVDAGYYIYGVVVRGASGTYPYSITGNGFNAGFGTAVSGSQVPVQLFTDMPDEDLIVEVYFKKGIPETIKSLTLLAKDEDNTDNKAQNWAKATVYDLDANGFGDLTQPTGIELGEVGRHADHGNGTMYDTDFVAPGKWVVVDFHADTGYYVSKVTVGPSNLGVAVIWESPTQISFYMPPGDAGVTVEFAKGEAPTYVLNVRETWVDTNNNAVAWDKATGYDVNPNDPFNYVTAANSYTISGDGYNAAPPAGWSLGWNGGYPVKLLPETNPERVPGVGAAITATGAAKSGEKVTMTFTVDESAWTIQSIILFSDGAATRLTDEPKRLVAQNGDKKTYEIDFHMPTGNAEFTVHYREKSDANDFPFTMVLYDSDNTGAVKDDNRLKASFADPTGTTGAHAPMELGLATPGAVTTNVRHVHAGDVVTLETQLQKGYSVDYLIINPANLSLYPAWQSTVTDAAGVTKSVAKFTMPPQGVAVVARYIKGAPKEYNANLILCPPAGYDLADMKKIGWGTFGDPTAGTLDSYPTKAVFSTSQVPGTGVDYNLYAFDGFYIERVDIQPAVGATGSLSGSFGHQSGDFIMPAADVNVYVHFKKGWPDEVKYGLSLEVHDAARNGDGTGPDNYAAFRSAGSAALDSAKVYGGQKKVLWGAAYDRDVVVVDIHADRPDYYYDANTLTVTDSQGNAISWWYVPGGIAFVMPPRTTGVVVTFKDTETALPTYKAELVVLGADTAAGDAAELTDRSGNGAPASVSAATSGGTISGLYHQDVLGLSAKPGANRHIAAVYAVYTVGADTETVPIYTDADGDGYPDAPPTLSQFVPGDPAAAVAGLLAMPEANVTVYVRFADKAVRDTDKWVTLWVSGAKEAGRALADIDGVNAMSVYTPGGVPTIGGPVNAVSGMDTRLTPMGSEVIVTFEPAAPAPSGKTYDIVKLEVYDKNGKDVPYEWISVLQDPPTLTDTNMWPAPPTDPSATITHPGWIPNPKRQIKLSVPADSVTIHVTYGEVDTSKSYTAQIVVNDEMYPTAPGTPASRNNGWFGLLDDATKARLRTAKPGEWIDLSVNVHPGYRIEYIKVIPQSYGIVPTLPYGDIYDQNTGFYMPNGDCTVYIKFVADPTETKTATLVVNGAPVGNAANYGTIHSPISGTSPHVIVGDSREVQARPNVDWITVDYYWAAGSSIASITVQTINGANGTDIPYTQNEDLATRHGQIVLPMAAKDVQIVITYQDTPDPVGQEVVLHVIDKDRVGRDATPPTCILRDPAGTPLNYGRLQAVYAVGQDTGLVGPDSYPTAADPYESVYTIWVPAGERVNVTASSDNSANGADNNGTVYIESAYVLYEAGGQMLNMNLTPDVPGPGFSGLKNSHFTVHQGRNDVYVTLTRAKPTQNEYSAVLMLKGPVDNSGQAGICVGDNYVTADPDRRDELTQANHGHAYVTATQGEDITVNVVPAPGYAIDYIQVTPLGYPLSYTYLVNESTVQFKMPHCNIAITVYLKKAEKQQYKLNLHYRVDPNADPGVSPDNYAKTSWLNDDGVTETIWAWGVNDNRIGDTPPGASTDNWKSDSAMWVKSGESVTLSVTLDDPDLILAAYVLADGDLVPLTPTYPTGRTMSQGLEGLGESASATDNKKSDAVATFDMPSADADVFIVVTNKAPYPDWSTIILTASDYSPAGNNLGKSFGYLNEAGRPDAQRQKVESWGGANVALSHTYMTLPIYDAGGNRNYFTVDTEPGLTYELDIPGTHMVRNVPVYVQSLIPESLTPHVNYRVPVGEVVNGVYTNCNKVVHLIFRSQDDLTLTVEIDDPDNPGNGTVTNAVTTATTGVDTLNLTSQSVAGAYQIMTGVTAGAPVNLTVTPASGYSAYAFLYKSDGSDPEEVPLTAAAGGTLTGSFTMPPNTARVVVTFYKPYTGTLTLLDNTGHPTTKAQMTESTGTAPDQVSVNALLATSQSATLNDLPSGTKLRANMVDFDPANPARKVTALLTTRGSTTFLTGTVDAGITYYDHTIDRADATITLIVDDKGTTEEEYVAAVQVVDRPDSLKDAQLPKIVDATAAKFSGSIWTVAHSTDTVKVTVSVPEGYEAVVTTDSGETLTPVTAGPGTGTSVTLGAGNDLTFTMPAHDVLVTVRYVRTHYDLTLHIADTSGVSGNETHLKASAVWSGDPSDLAADGASTRAKVGAAVDLTATPAAGAKLKRIIYQIDGQAPVFVTLPADPTTGYDSDPNDLLTMPNANVDVTVIYGKDYTPDPPPEPDPEDYYIASAVKDDPTAHPDNQILSIQNVSRSTLLDGRALPGADPYWVAGYAKDSVVVTYQAAPGYYVSVTAQDSDGVALPVVQVGSTALGNASAAFPNPGRDITITVHYSTDAPTYPETQAALQLVEHKAQAANKAVTTDFTGNALSGLSVKGNDLTHAPGYPSGVVSKDPTELKRSTTTTGNDLRTLANWGDGYHVLRMTVAVRKYVTDGSGNAPGDPGYVDTCLETGELDLAISTYGGAATSRCPVPPLGENEIPVIRVYYGNIYDATLHIVGAAATDKTEATDNVNYTNAFHKDGTAILKPIKTDLDELRGYHGYGGETITTTAIPDATKPAPNHRLVGVVYASDLTGARATTDEGNHKHSFLMPEDNVDFYAVYEPEPDDPKDRSYIAKVALADDSEAIAGTQNAVSIRNVDNNTALKGRYWVAAKGGESVAVNVKVAQGYQAQIITTKVDDPNKKTLDDPSKTVLDLLPDIYDDTTSKTRKPTAADDYQYYIDRTQFIYNLPAGKDATFTMPAETDATVTVRFTKGYDLTMELDDRTTPPATGTTVNMTESDVADTVTSSKTYGTITNKTENTSAGQTSTDDTNTATVSAGSGKKFVRLTIDRAGNANNTVRLYAQNVPDRVITGNNSKLIGLNKGDVILLEVTPAPGYECRVDVNREADGAQIQVVETKPSGIQTYTFTMPTLLYSEVTAKVTFRKTTTPASLMSLSAAAIAPSGGAGNTLYDLPGNLRVNTNVMVDDSLSDVQARHFQTTPFTGTKTILATSGSGERNFKFVMGYEDTLGTTLLTDDEWFAKVELDGASDVTGNTATPVVDYTDTTQIVDKDGDGKLDGPANMTRTGTVWTSTEKGHVIDLSLTVASGYVAKIKVRRDNDNYYKNPTDPTKWDYLDAWRYEFTNTTQSGSPAVTNTGKLVGAPVGGALEADIDEVTIGYGEGYLPASLFPDAVSGRQNFRFLMPTETAAVGKPGDANYHPGDKMSDVTIIVEFEKVTDMPRPFDPRTLTAANPKMEKIDLERGFIYGENRGDYAIVEIPTLAQEEESAVKLFDTDNYDTVTGSTVVHNPKKAADKEVKRYIFALYDAKTGQYTELKEGTDVTLVPYDEEALARSGDPYNYIRGLYNGSATLDAATGKRDFVGSKFLLAPLPQDDGSFTASGQKLYEMLNNKGSLESYNAPDPADPDKTVKRWRTTLCVMAEDAGKRQSAYTPVWIRPWFALGVNVISYAPTHELQGELHKLMNQHELDVAKGVASPTASTALTDKEVFTNYQWSEDDRADFDDAIVLEEDLGGKWLQVLRIRSSDLLGGYDYTYDPAENASRTLLDNVKSSENLTYALVLKKDANLTYRRIKIELNPASYAAPAKLTDYYMDGDPATRTFLLQDTIHLIAGDVDGNGRVKHQDYDAVFDFVYRDRPWSKMKKEPEKPAAGSAGAVWDSYYADLADWGISIYNPDAWAYRADVDGDRTLTVSDVDIVVARFNYNRTERSYDWYDKAASSYILPYGLGQRSGDYAALFSLQPMEGEAPSDAYWDEPLDPDTEETVPLDTIWVDEDGQLHEGAAPSEDEEVPDESQQTEPASDDERRETPKGEEATGRFEGEDMAVIPGMAVGPQQAADEPISIDLPEGEMGEDIPEAPETPETLSEPASLEDQDAAAEVPADMSE